MKAYRCVIIFNSQWVETIELFDDNKIFIFLRTHVTSTLFLLTCSIAPEVYHRHNHHQSQYPVALLFCPHQFSLTTTLLMNVSVNHIPVYNARSNYRFMTTAHVRAMNAFISRPRWRWEVKTVRDFNEWYFGIGILLLLLSLCRRRVVRERDLGEKIFINFMSCGK